MTHIVVDNFAPLGLIRSLAATWLPADSGHWHLYDNGKRATKDAAHIPRAGRALLEQMAAIDVEAAIGVAGAFPDLEYLHGAGLHQIDAGGLLGRHLDSERHPVLPWKREASAVLYVDDCDGGELVIGDERIDVVQNRLVLFSTPGQWHRVAECRSIRRSVCLFFWRIDNRIHGRTRANFEG